MFKASWQLVETEDVVLSLKLRQLAVIQLEPIFLARFKTQKFSTNQQQVNTHTHTHTLKGKNILLGEGDGYKMTHTILL